MIPVNILDETAQLEAVILGTANSFGGVPKLEETYDPKSKSHIIAGTYPNERELTDEMQEVVRVLERHDVEVYRPDIISDYNQIFVRDIALVIGDKLIVPCVTPMRKLESDGIQDLVDEVDDVLLPDEEERIEGGDVLPWKGHLFVGFSKKADFKKYESARTNEAGVEFLRKNFPDWKLKAFELVKSDDDPRENALHLDCCFQPVGEDKAVIYKGGFKNVKDYKFLIDFFGKENVFEINKEEMYNMNCNIFSISPKVVISDSSFVRMNHQFRKWKLKVEEVKYREVSKMEGLLRCTTMPLSRRYD